MERNIESSSSVNNKIARLAAVAVLCLGLFPSSAFAETCMTESLMMIDEAVEVKRPRPVKKVKPHGKDPRVAKADAVKTKISAQSVSLPLDVSGTKISHAHTQDAR